ncbi:Acg family FMN-binding oxidoreductase [Streptomyces sp. TRM64462]|uniref:Acg family FMN-binding oxidoreductase n=1 Tax=Streptomyces sp. TRM64462 TaxID=2741726 RepID=UPI001586E223|nr:nitroreductase [Streptomyces sp. TRM64462]
MSPHPLDEPTVKALVADAVAAPSMHNAQPWKFRFDRAGGTFHVRSDPERGLPRADPAGRALHIGCGAALFNLRVAAAHAGWEPSTRLLPDPADPRLLATVELTGPVRPGTDLAELYPAIHRRHTSRYPFSEEEPPEAIRDGLRGAALLEGARLVFPASWHVESVLDLVHDAEGRDALGDAETGLDADTARWTHTDAGTSDTAPDGIPAYAFGPGKHGGKAPVRDFAGRRPVPGRGTATFESHPHLALLGTAGDQPRDWLIAGQAMERVLLQATLDGLATSLTSHALEWPELRWAVRDPQSAMGFVQMVLRLGYGETGPATPRRPVDEVLDIS